MIITKHNIIIGKRKKTEQKIKAQKRRHKTEQKTQTQSYWEERRGGRGGKGQSQRGGEKTKLQSTVNIRGGRGGPGDPS